MVARPWLAEGGEGKREKSMIKKENRMKEERMVHIGRSDERKRRQTKVKEGRGGVNAEREERMKERGENIELKKGRK